MKSIFPPAILLCLFIGNLSAQKKVFRINPGEKVVEKIPKEELFTYPEFMSGSVFFRNKTVANARMNYNCYYSEMQFINPKGDTLSLDDEGTIREIVIVPDTFYFSAGYVKQIENYGNAKLASRTHFSFYNREKLTGFGESSSGGIETYSTMSTRTYLSELVAQEIISLTKADMFFIGDRFGNFRVANKKNITEMYRKKEKEVLSFIKTNKTDFSKEEDIRKLMNYFTVNK